MKDRLSKIIKTEGLNTSLLANELDVQRSGIAHILSGRNNPSFDFLQKLLERFPKLNADWLILGKGSMYKSTFDDVSDLLKTPLPLEKTEVSPTLPEKPQDLPSVENSKKTVPDDMAKISPSTAVQKTIEKIIILYTDKTFATYFPED